ncbi:hypothetical protein B0T16DRAFT_200461 [Cercophora newfieldiana]|uniref:Uncharacterized protein n=1 Tax=Cercophora newfieldiana TaxID=92897 RepID=A0AA39XWZ6_9PEZI|nr:hypothetical protein B0T16DRAFT_200461 [Cercophora newfieldiana]
MPATEIITIINNSGKVISTGKQLVGIFKEAKAAYREKREHIKLERAERAGIQRAKTFDVTPRGGPDRYYEEDELDDHVYDRRAIRDSERRRSQDDLHSMASSHRSHRSRRSERPDRERDRDRDRERRPALTIANLQTHSEVSATAPSAAPNGTKPYRAPYAETAPRDMQLSRPNLAHAATMPLPPRSEAPTMTTATTPVATARQSMLVHRPRSDPSLKKKKEIDMHLAYGDIPPDLATRADLDRDVSHRSPHGSGELQLAAPVSGQDDTEAQALTMVDRIENLLEEAQCVHHTASSMIANLQQNPQAAAAVALTLAELSALIGKMSPAFLPVLKGSSPAIFALLASPQFLIGTSVVVGVTVVIFGGWKIVKKIKENAAGKAMEAPFEMQNLGEGQKEGDVPREGGAEYEEALVLEEELSTIETWRRGITPFGAGIDEEDDETADVELMSPEAERHLREKYRDAEVDPMDSVSQVGARSHRSGRSHAHRSRRHHRERKHEDDEVDVPERKSSRRYKDKEGESEVAESVRSHRSSRSHHSSSSKHSSRTKVKAIEEGKEEGEGDVVKGGKEKKNNMLKQLFKKMKDKEDGEGKKEGSRAMSVLV